MHILVASAPHADTFGYSMPPPGLLRLGGWLRQVGHKVDLVDLAFELAAGNLGSAKVLDEDSLRTAADIILGRDPEVVGLSTMGATLPAALVIASELRQRKPGLHIHLGGPGVGSIEARLLKRFEDIDLIVHGEGELTLVEVLDRLGNAPCDVNPRVVAMDGVAGVSWRTESGQVRTESANRAPLDLAQVAPCAWDLLPPTQTYKAITGGMDGLVPVDSGRGCSYDCSFCSIGRFWERRSRTLPVNQLVEEVLHLTRVEGAQQAYLCHDLFGADRNHALEFCKRMSALGSPIPWECRARSDHMDREILQAMGQAGCYRVLLGVESAVPEVRAVNHKKMSGPLDVLALVQECSAAGITPILSFILGLPGEGESELAATLDLCADASLGTGLNLSLHLANPQPGCALGEEYNSQAVALEGIAPDMAFGAGQSDPEQQLIAAHPDLFSTWHLLALPEEHLRDLARMAQLLPPLLQRYPRTFALLRRLRAQSTLELFRDLRAERRSFEGLARAMDEPLVDDALAWEQLTLRVSSLGAPRILRARHDLSQLTGALISGAPLPNTGSPASHCFAVAPTDGPCPGTRMTRLSHDLARVFEQLNNPDVHPTVDTQHPAIAKAVECLTDAGLLSSSTPQA